jgi:hypothetical protein
LLRAGEGREGAGRGKAIKDAVQPSQLLGVGGGLWQVGHMHQPPIDDTMSKHKMLALALKSNVREIF